MVLGRYRLVRSAGSFETAKCHKRVASAGTNRRHSSRGVGGKRGGTPPCDHYRAIFVVVDVGVVAIPRNRIHVAVPPR